MSAQFLGTQSLHLNMILYCTPLLQSGGDSLLNLLKESWLWILTQGEEVIRAGIMEGVAFKP